MCEEHVVEEFKVPRLVARGDRYETGLLPKTVETFW